MPATQMSLIANPTMVMRKEPEREHKTCSLEDARGMHHVNLWGMHNRLHYISFY